MGLCLGFVFLWRFWRLKNERYLQCIGGMKDRMEDNSDVVTNVNYGVVQL